MYDLAPLYDYPVVDYVQTRHGLLIAATRFGDG